MLVDYDGTVSSQASTQTIPKSPGGSSETASVAPPDDREVATKASRDKQNNDKDDVFSDSDAEEGISSKNKRSQTTSSSTSGTVLSATSASGTDTKKDQVSNLAHETERMSLGSTDSAQPKTVVAAPVPVLSTSESEFKAMAADASVFTFGDEEDYESD